jgi:hypothetical protein
MENATIQIESDCLPVVQSIIAEHTNYFEFSSIIDMCCRCWLLITTGRSVMSGDK